MSASSPSPSSNGLSAAVTPPKTLRGLNKPKCAHFNLVKVVVQEQRTLVRFTLTEIEFFYNHGLLKNLDVEFIVHDFDNVVLVAAVLKVAATSAEKTQAPSTPSSDQKASEGTPGSTTRVSSIRQLSSNFAQFNNLNAASRQRKPLTIKDAQALNEWRFTKLKEYRDRNIEVENEAFDRYMNNVHLLEEAFSLTSVPEEDHPGEGASERSSEERTVSELKLRLRSNSARTESFKKRIAETVKAGLVKVKKSVRGGKSDDQEETKRRNKRSRWEEKTSALSEIIDKLNKARTEEDLKSCVEMKSKLFGQVSSNAASEKNKGLIGSVQKVEISEAVKKMGEQLVSVDKVEAL
ncbi:unnamed protein product [Thlaspi arvense]|uniref:Uncharacterized protein n=1 Tax=Thlaspi arvense TaxID=13288 RepID=A0AAU9R848_THLAR|nr:unnamed protein product [Thlaspi arvense]